MQEFPHPILHQQTPTAERCGNSWYSLFCKMQHRDFQYCLPGTAFSLGLPLAVPIACQCSASSDCNPHIFTTCHVFFGPHLHKWKQRICLYLRFSEANSSMSPKGSKLVLGSQRRDSVGNQPGFRSSPGRFQELTPQESEGSPQSMSRFIAGAS